MNLTVLTDPSLKANRILLGKGFDIHKAIGKLPRPKKGWVLPGYKYAGPFNPLDEQLDEDDNPLPGHEPFNQIDEIALHHDICYRDSNNKKDKHVCDKKMLNNLKTIKPKNFREKVDRKLVQGVIGFKRMAGLSINQKKIINNLFN